MPQLTVSRDPLAEEVIRALIKLLDLSHVDPKRVRVVWSNSRSNASARIWGLSKVLQAGLDTGPTYVIELVAPNFSRLGCRDKVDTLAHELAHIPKTFSGAVRPHNRYFRREIRRIRKVLRSLSRTLIEELCRNLRNPGVT